MRILLVSPNYPSVNDKHPFGFVHSRAKLYSAEGLKVQVFVPSTSVQSYNYEGIEVFKGSLICLGKVLKTFDHDVIALHAPTPYLLLYLLRFQRPIVVWIHGAEVLIRALHHYISPFGIKNYCLKVFTPVQDVARNIILSQALRKVNAIVCVSQWMKEMLQKYLLLQHPNTFVIPNPVDTDLFRPIGMDDETQTFRGISVRGLEWKYGLDVAIRAFSGSKIELVIAGKGKLEKYLRSLARELNSNVKFITNGIEHNRLPRVYNSMSFFVAPSRTEAQGVAMCEAMACGLPIIASSVGGIPEFVTNGYNGFLVPANDTKGLREAVEKLARSDMLFERLSENARKFALDKLSHESVLGKELRILRLASGD